MLVTCYDSSIPSGGKPCFFFSGLSSSSRLVSTFLSYRLRPSRGWPQWRAQSRWHFERNRTRRDVAFERSAAGLESERPGRRLFSLAFRKAASTRKSRGRASSSSRSTSRTATSCGKFRPAAHLKRCGDGPRGTPTVDGDRLYVVTGSGNLFCLDVPPGKRCGRRIW